MFEKNRFLCLINDNMFSDEKKFSDLLINLKAPKIQTGGSGDDVDNNEWSNLEEEDEDYENKISLIGDPNHVFKATLLENLSKTIAPPQAASSNVLPQNLDSTYHVSGVCSSLVYFHKSINIKQIKQVCGTSFCVLI